MCRFYMAFLIGQVSDGSGIRPKRSGVCVICKKIGCFHHRAVFAIAQLFQNILKVAGPSEPEKHYGQNGAACSLQIQV